MKIIRLRIILQISQKVTVIHERPVISRHWKIRELHHVLGQVRPVEIENGLTLKCTLNFAKKPTRKTKQQKKTHNDTRQIAI